MNILIVVLAIALLLTWVVLAYQIRAIKIIRGENKAIVEMLENISKPKITKRRLV